MFNSLFLAPTWIWISLFAAAVLIPVLIHLINLWRYQNVKWAAMEFLLKGLRKRKKQIQLTQILLIASRISLLVIAILFFAQVDCRPDKSQLAGQPQLHLIIVDDSGSMGQLQSSAATDDPEIQSANCYDNANQGVLQLVNSLSQEPGQKFLLLKTSNIIENSDLNFLDCDSNASEAVGASFSQPVTGLSLSPYQWILNNIEFLPVADQVYLFSDFRQKDLQEEAATTAIKSLRQAYKRCTFVQCASPSTEPNNLSFVGLEPENSILSAGVPFYVSVRIKNNSQQTRTNLKVKIRRSQPGDLQLNSVTESTMLVPKLEAGQSANLQLPVLVNSSGTFVVEGELSPDQWSGDNSFHRVLTAEVFNKVLILADNGNFSVRYLEWLFSPRIQGSLPVNSGFRTERRNLSELNSLNDSLSDYRVVILFMEELNYPAELQKLNDYVQQGGLLFLIPSTSTDINEVNRLLYRNGQGLLPCPIDSIVDLPPREKETPFDLRIVDSELMDSFGEDANKLVSEVSIYRKFIPPRDWQPKSVSVLPVAEARGRATTPLLIQARNGKGTIYSFLSPLDEKWNNWAVHPTFLVMIYQLIFNGSPFDFSLDLSVGQGLEELLENPTTQPTQLKTVEFLPGLNQPVKSKNTFKSIKEYRCLEPGIVRITEAEQSRLNSFNVDPLEGELEIAKDQSIDDLILPDSRNRRAAWNELGQPVSEYGSRSDLIWWMALLAFFLLEQVLSYRLGFHRSDKPSHNPLHGFTRRRHG